MQGKLIRRNAARPVRPALTALLLTGATVAAVGQPLALPRKPASLSQPVIATPDPRPATVRVVLPLPSVAATKVSQPSATVRIPLAEPAAPAAPQPVALAASSQPDKAPMSASPAKIMRPRPITEAEATTKLAEARGKDVAAYSAAVKEIAASRRPEPIAMVDAGTRAAAMRMYGGGEFAPSETTGLATSRSPARSLVGSLPMQPDAAPQIEPERSALAEPADRKPRSIASVSLEVTAKINGAAAGRVSLLIRDSDNISVRLSDVLPLLQPALAPELYERISALQGPGYVTFNDLRAAGLSVRFDARDRLLITAKH